jgi:hypothetical protein
MSGSTLYTLFDFTDLRLADRANILRGMGALASGDRFRFLKKAIVCDDMPGEKYVPNTPELLDRAWTNAVRAAPRYGGAYWMEFEGSSGVTLAFGFDPRKLKRLNLTISRSAFTGPNGDAVAADLFEAVDSLAYALGPDYGYGLFNYDTHEALPVGAGPQAAWDLNIFSAGRVQQIGRDALKSVPAWRSVDLQGGGMVLALASNPVTGAQASKEAARALAAVLGVTTLTLGGG